MHTLRAPILWLAQAQRLRSCRPGRRRPPPRCWLVSTHRSAQGAAPGPRRGSTRGEQPAPPRGGRCSQQLLWRTWGAGASPAGRKAALEAGVLSGPAMEPGPPRTTRFRGERLTWQRGRRCRAPHPTTRARRPRRTSPSRRSTWPPGCRIPVVRRGQRWRRSLSRTRTPYASRPQCRPRGSTARARRRTEASRTPEAPAQATVAVVWKRELLDARKTYRHSLWEATAAGQGHSVKRAGQAGPAR
mmetsp:Transcript_10316/g.26223  ORF Transcript_10316/g.26223 Transcript_10316/m.26223 type:complete len:244 (-) Transcript_10316:278-1009(-)